jgi:hypothetical protein
MVVDDHGPEGSSGVSEVSRRASYLKTLDDIPLRWQLNPSSLGAPSDVGRGMQCLPQNSMVVDDHGSESSSGVSVSWRASYLKTLDNVPLR